MHLLAISTSTPHWTVWLHRGDGWHRGVAAEAGRGTGERASLTRLVWDLLAAAELQPAELQRVVCDVGPGSFTGLRQGLALARALAWAHGIPTHAAGSLDAMAWQTQPLLLPHDRLVVALPARADVDFIALRDGQTLHEQALTAAEAPAWWQHAQPTVLAVPAADRTRALARLALGTGARVLEVQPEAETMGRWSLSQPIAASALTPRYLAVSEAEVNAGVAMPEVTLLAEDRSGAPNP